MDSPALTSASSPATDPEATDPAADADDEADGGVEADGGGSRAAATLAAVPAAVSAAVAAAVAHAWPPTRPGRAQAAVAAAVLAITVGTCALDAGGRGTDAPGASEAAVGPVGAVGADAGAPDGPAAAPSPPDNRDSARDSAGDSAPRATGDSRYDSGRIGRWQEMGHERSTPAAERAAAAAPAGALLVGDSSLTRTRPQLVAALAPRPLTWDHWNGRPTHGSVDVVAAIDGARRLPATIVLMSGSNDIFSPGEFPAQIDKLLSIAGPTRRVVWVAPYVARPRHSVADVHNTRAIRADLLRAARRHANLRVVDWADHVLALPAVEQRRLMPDGAHPSPAGCAALTRLIVAAMG